jgi:Ca2+-binding EF-hand superfamily protein
MWEKIKKWFGFADLNKDGKVSAEDLELAKALAEKKYREANAEINKLADKAEVAVAQADAVVKKVKKATKKK